MSKPSIFGFCEAGCKWEVPHKDEIEGLADAALQKLGAMIRHAANAINIDNTAGNWVVNMIPVGEGGIYVQETQGTLPDRQWYTVAQFEGEHFAFQFAVDAYTTSEMPARLFIRQSYIGDNERLPWSAWRNVSENENYAQLAKQPFDTGAVNSYGCKLYSFPVGTILNVIDVGANGKITDGKVISGDTIAFDNVSQDATSFLGFNCSVNAAKIQANPSNFISLAGQWRVCGVSGEYKQSDVYKIILSIQRVE